VAVGRCRSIMDLFMVQTVRALIAKKKKKLPVPLTVHKYDYATTEE
jgi:hypothetical protein